MADMHPAVERVPMDVDVRPAWAPSTPPPDPDPKNKGEARQGIEQTRARLSETLDQLEYRLADKKQELRDKANVVGRVRELVGGRELLGLAAAFGVGLLIALARGAGRSGDGLSSEERKMLHRWSRERKEILSALERLGKAVEDLGD